MVSKMTHGAKKENVFSLSPNAEAGVTRGNAFVPPDAVNDGHWPLLWPLKGESDGFMKQQLSGEVTSSHDAGAWQGPWGRLWPLSLLVGFHKSVCSC